MAAQVPEHALTAQDWRDYLDYIRRGPMRRRALATETLTVAFPGMAIGLLLWRHGAWIALSMAVILSLGTLLVVRVAERHRGTQLAASPLHSAPKSVTLDHDGIEVRLPTGSGRTSWQAVQKIAVHRGVLVMWLGHDKHGAVGIVVPRSALPDDVSFQAFVAEAQRLWHAARSPPVA